MTGFTLALVSLVMLVNMPQISPYVNFRIVSFFGILPIIGTVTLVLFIKNEIELRFCMEPCISKKIKKQSKSKNYAEMEEDKV